jgi:hypothetical protein
MKSRSVVVACFLIVVLVLAAIWAIPAAAQDRETFNLTICKKTVPRGIDQTFRFEWKVLETTNAVESFNLRHGQCETLELLYDREYAIEEIVPEGWEVEIECDFDLVPTPGNVSSVSVPMDDEDHLCTFTNYAPPSGAPPFVPEASTFVLLGGAAMTLAGYVSLQIRARRRR